MRFLIFFITFIIFYTFFNWITKKTNIHGKIYVTFGKHKHLRIVFILILILSTFSLEYERQLLNEKYGEYSYIVSILGAFLWSIYVNFTPTIFKRNMT